MEIKLGIVGACGRGLDFKKIGDALDGVSVHAVCDSDRQKLVELEEEFANCLRFVDYQEMLDCAGLDAVIIATPMPYHLAQTIAALAADLHVMCEVPACVSVAECKELVAACKKSKGSFMLAENYSYTRSNRIISELVRLGAFGAPYYAEGEYLHEIKDYATLTPWRRKWQLGIDGITYGTHSLGPILQWMPGDRVTRVCCEGTGPRHKDQKGEFFCQSSSVMLCKTANDALIKIRVDLLSDRPHACFNYQLQGTDGAYESSRGGPNEIDKVWLREFGAALDWSDLSTFVDDEKLAERYLPVEWQAHAELAYSASHGGGDYFEVLDFLQAIRGDKPPLVGIHEAMDITLPGLISQQSIAQGGAWLPVPDSRDW